ncbi:MAG TPA: polysaccharide biosynthesis/export family protein [Urbifossiella sp.]|jgi:polysaccharide export outer membrane protein|nr:polysaccharide biosynthesis/export family protein [Urbifossiella sp.]
MGAANDRWRRAASLGMAVLTAVSGCFQPYTYPSETMPGQAPGVGVHGQPGIAVPPPGAVPRELDKITLPPYVIEAPDNLIIHVVERGKGPERDAKGDPLPDPKNPGKNLERDIVKPLPIQPVEGSFQVRLDGTVGLGFWGSVMVAGLTLDQAADTIRQHLIRSEALRSASVRPESLIVVVDVLAYNSKWYYVVTDGGGYGEQLYRFPIMGSETVMDAMSNIYGLPAVASKRNIWIARRCPTPNQPWQILPVDWVGITQHGLTETNYQIMPGDRIYVKAQRIITIDTAMARVISPIERLFGITLLGSSTVNQISGRTNSGSGQ